MTKFNVGDIIRANEKSNNIYDYANQENNWSGIVLNHDSKGYFIAKTLSPSKLRGRIYSGLNEKRFDLVQKQIQKHIVNKNTVVIILQDGRKGVAKCNPTDKFNPAFGTVLAVARAYGDKETEAKLLAEPIEEVKEKPKFKVGELVRIRQWDDMEKEYGLDEDGDISINPANVFMDSMVALCGKYAKIVSLYEDDGVELEFFNCKHIITNWKFTIDMIEKV